MNHDDVQRIDRSLQRVRLLWAAVVAAALLCVVSWRRADAAAGALVADRVQASRVANDLRAIRRLRDRPEQAVEAPIESSQLLSTVQSAMRASGVSERQLLSTLPEPSRRTRGSDHAVVKIRLQLQGLTMKQLVHFGVALRNEHPALRLAALNLRPERDGEDWDAEIVVAYSVYASR